MQINNFRRDITDPAIRDVVHVFITKIIKMNAIEAFCKALPKVELHAHLNGCIRESTIRELSPQIEPHVAPQHRSLDQCFALFKQIHEITTDLDHVKRITQEVIQDFEDDNVIYLELRTTPKNRPDRGISKRNYIETVLSAKDSFYNQNPQARIQVRFLLSIDRRESTEDAIETVRLAIDHQSKGIVGIDLSGDPLLGTFNQWKVPFTLARENGLKLTFHAGETKDYEETQRLIDFEPERLGHLCFTNPSIQNCLRTKRIPIEICLTSNLLTKSVNRLEDHQLISFYKNNHPVVFCTDDSGVFGTTLSHEYILATQTLDLNHSELLEIAIQSIDCAFCDDSLKTQLRLILKEFRQCAKKFVHE